jgi:hypothetical protein
MFEICVFRCFGKKLSRLIFLVHEFFECANAFLVEISTNCRRKLIHMHVGDSIRKLHAHIK